MSLFEQIEVFLKFRRKDFSMLVLLFVTFLNGITCINSLNVGCEHGVRFSGQSSHLNKLIDQNDASISVQSSSNGPLWMECQSSNGPADFKWSGFLQNLKVETSRYEISRISQKFCYKISINFTPDERSTGDFICSEIAGTNSTHISSIFIFSKGSEEKSPNLRDHGRQLSHVYFGNESQLILPCISTNPNATIYLSKKISSDFFRIEKDDSFIYNPQKGFIIQPKQFRYNLYGEFKCSSRSHSAGSAGDGHLDSDWDFVQINIKDYQVIPTSEEIHLSSESGQNTTELSCISSKPIGLKRNGVAIGDGYKKSEVQSIYKSSIGIKYDSMVLKVDIECFYLENNVTFHKWTLLPSVKIPKLVFEKAHFKCYGLKGIQPIIHFTPGSNPIECREAVKCSQNDYHDCNRQSFISSCDSNKNRNDSCTILRPSEGQESGIVNCLSGNFMSDNFVFYRETSTGEIRLFGPNHKGFEDLLQIEGFRSSDPLYLNQNLKVQCSGPKFVFFSGFFFKMRHINGSYLTPEVLSMRQWSNSSTITSEVELKMNQLDIQGIYCTAPIWNSMEIVNISRNIQILKSTTPEIQFFNKTLEKLNNKTSIHLSCKASGIPVPFINFYMDHEIISPETGAQFTQKELGNNSRLLEVELDKFYDILFTCNATNVNSTVLKNISLTEEFSEDKEIGFGLFMGISVGGSFLILVIIITFGTMVAYYRRISKKVNGYASTATTDLDIEEFYKGNPEALKKCVCTYEKALYLPYKSEEYEINSDDLIIDYDDILGCGEFGIVHRGILYQDSKETSVAVKTAKPGEILHVKALLSELKILTYIGYHDHIVSLIGACTTDLIKNNNLSLVVELCPYGSLEKYLRQHRGLFLDEFKEDTLENFVQNKSSADYVRIDFALKTSDLIKWSYQIANAMEHLASKNVIHGDLATRNILLTADRDVKLSDFGLSKHLYNHSNYISGKQIPLPWKWLSIETLRHMEFSTQGDIWSFGVTLWEIFTLGEVPYIGYSLSPEFLKKLIEGFRLSKPKFANNEIFGQMNECWSVDPPDRPTFTQLKCFFKQFNCSTDNDNCTITSCSSNSSNISISNESLVYT